MLRRNAYDLLTGVHLGGLDISEGKDLIDDTLLSLHSRLSVAEAHVVGFVHSVFVAVTGGGSVGKCGRLSQLR